MIRTVSYLLFAVGVVMATCGGAKLPVQVTRSTLDEFSQQITDESFVAADLRDLVVGESEIVFSSGTSEQDSQAQAFTIVSLQNASEQQRADLIAQLTDKNVKVALGQPPSIPSFPDTVPLFAAGMAIGLLGLVIWRSDLAKQKRTMIHDPTSADGDPLQLLAELIKPTQELENEISKLSAAEIEQRVDQLLERYVLPFAEYRHQVTTRLGMTTGAEILVTAAIGERLLNRVWSAAGDGHLLEACNSYPEAVRAFEETHRLAEAATS